MASFGFKVRNELLVQIKFRCSQRGITHKTFMEEAIAELLQSNLSCFYEAPIAGNTKVTVQLSDNLYKQAKVEAAQKNITIQALGITAVINKLKADSVAVDEKLYIENSLFALKELELRLSDLPKAENAALLFMFECFKKSFLDNYSNHRKTFNPVMAGMIWELIHHLDNMRDMAVIQ